MRTALCSAVAISLVSSVALAQDAPLKISIDPYARHAFDADLDGGSSVAVTRLGSNVFFDKVFSEGTFGRIKLLGEYTHYDFDAADGVLDDGITAEIRPSLVNYFNEHFSVYGGALIGFGGEPSADVADALYYGGYLGFNYEIAPGVWVGTGVGVQTQLEDSPLFVPLFTLDLKLSDNLTLSADGLSATLTYVVNDEWSVFVDGRYEYRQYRLDDGNAAIPDGVLSDETVPVSIGVTYKASDNFSLSAAGGAIVWRHLEFRDDSENEIASDDVDPTLFVGLNAKWSF